MKYGLPLDKPITQTVLPVISFLTNQILCVVPIAKITFDTPEYDFEFSNGVKAKVISITIPHSSSTKRVEQYMGIVLDYRATTDRVYHGYPGVVLPNHFSYYFNIMGLTSGTYTISNLGMLTAFFYGMDKVDFGIGVEKETELEKIPGWNAKMQLSDFNNIQFFDFRWDNLFFQKREREKWPDAKIEIKEVDPLFRVLLVENTITRNNDTIRILKTQKDIGVGTYKFLFCVSSPKRPRPVVVSMGLHILEDEKNEP